jgi:hypothetical protein
VKILDGMSNIGLTNCDDYTKVAPRLCSCCGGREYDPTMLGLMQEVNTGLAFMVDPTEEVLAKTVDCKEYTYNKHVLGNKVLLVQLRKVSCD